MCPEEPSTEGLDKLLALYQKVIIFWYKVIIFSDTDTQRSAVYSAPSISYNASTGILSISVPYIRSYGTSTGLTVPYTTYSSVTVYFIK